MYLGNMMELTTSDELFDEPLHPYTQALLSANPVPDPEVKNSKERIVLQGDPPSPISPPSGCQIPVLGERTQWRYVQRKFRNGKNIKTIIG